MPSIVPLIDLTLDKPRHLRLGNAQLCQAEVELSAFWNRDMSVYAALLQSPMRANDLSIILWQALLHEDPGLTLAQTRDLLDGQLIGDVIAAVQQAWISATQPAEPPTGEGNSTPGPLDGSPGDRSGPMDASN